MLEWCATTWDAEPSASEVRYWVSPTFQILRKLPADENVPQFAPELRHCVTVLGGVPHIAHHVFPADRGDGHFVGLSRLLPWLCPRAQLTPDVAVPCCATPSPPVAAEIGIAGRLGPSVPGIIAGYAHIPGPWSLPGAE